MAKKKVEEEAAVRNFTVTQQEPDKNGATVTIVEGTTTADDNSRVEIHVGGQVFNGGTTSGGTFRRAIPSTDEEITVFINGEAV